MLNDIIFIWFTVKNLFTVATMKKIHNNPLYSSVATRRSKTLSSHKNDAQSFTDGACLCV